MKDKLDLKFYGLEAQLNEAPPKKESVPPKEAAKKESPQVADKKPETPKKEAPRAASPPKAEASPKQSPKANEKKEAGKKEQKPAPAG